MVGYVAGMQFKSMQVLWNLLFLGPFFFFHKFEKLIASVLDERVRWAFILSSSQLLWLLDDIEVMFAGHQWKILTVTSGEYNIHCTWLTPFPATSFSDLEIDHQRRSLDTGQLLYNDNWPDAGQELGVKTFNRIWLLDLPCWMIDWLVFKMTSWQSAASAGANRYFIGRGNILIKCGSLKKKKNSPQTLMPRARNFILPLPPVEWFQSTCLSNRSCKKYHFLNLVFQRKGKEQCGWIGRMTMPSNRCLALMWSLIIEGFWSVEHFGLIIQNSSASPPVSLPASHNRYRFFPIKEQGSSKG